MGRKKGFDSKKIGSIVKVLLDNQDGIWISRIAEIAGLHPTTVTKYLEGPLAPLIEDNSLGAGKPILRVIRLKPFVIDKLQQGQSFDQIMRFLRLMDKIEK